MSRLFEPLSIGSLALDNRIVIAPMCQYSAENGNAVDWHTIHVGHLALSGAGLMILGGDCGLGRWQDLAWRPRALLGC